jgi:hypothetical protein
MSVIEERHFCEDRRDFVGLLRWWLEQTDEKTIGEVEPFPGRPWVLVEAGSTRCHLNADTARVGVRRFLELVRQHGDDLEWRVVANQRGKVNRVALGPDAELVEKFYLYTDDEMPAPTVL